MKCLGVSLRYTVALWLSSKAGEYTLMSDRHWNLPQIMAFPFHAYMMQARLREELYKMDYMDGDKLDQVWPKLTAEERSSVCRQTREILTTMRSIPWKTGLIGSYVGGKARDCRQYTDYSGGPFKDETEFNSSFYFDLLENTPSPIRRALYQQIRNDHCIVFSHGDLAQHNILVKDGRITGLLDWENAGWSPEHWD